MSNHKTPLTELERTGLVAHGLGRCIGTPSQLADVFRQGVAWALLKQDKPDAREMTEMLRAMQAGEMTVSRGRELLDMWLAGNYSDDQLPPVSEVLPEDKMPWDVIRELRANPVNGALDWKQGSLVTWNQDPYPSLGELFVQFWEGGDVAARVYGNDRETLNRRCGLLMGGRT